MNSGYSAADIYSMQKEAEKRVFEMQRRARRTLELENEAEKKPTAERNNFHMEEPRIDNVPQNEKTRACECRPLEKSISDGNLIDFLVQDKERAMIALLLLILIRENADESVILLLLYLMMDV